MKNKIGILLVLIVLSVQYWAKAQSLEAYVDTFKLNNIRTRDICVVPDPVVKVYYMVGPGRGGVNMRTSKDLLHWSASKTCLLYTSDAADEEDSVDLGGRRI